MIEELRISQLGVIEEAEVDFGAGMSALTGETGAGKTMTVTALQLLMGGKPDPSRVRSGADKAIVEGVLLFPKNSPAVQIALNAGAEVEETDDGKVSVILSRHVPASGRTRSFIGGRSVPAGVLADICQYALTLHGQADQLRLSSEVQQRAAVDNFGGSEIAQASSSYAKAWQSVLSAHKKLTDFDHAAKTAARERMALQMLVNRVDEVKPYIGEDSELQAEARRLENVQTIRAAVSAALAALSSDDNGDGRGAIELLGSASHELQRINDPSTDILAKQLDDVNGIVTDVHSELFTFMQQLNADPQRLDAIHSRRAEIRSLERELGMSIEQMLSEAHSARVRLEALEDPATHREHLRANFEQAMEAATSAAKVLSQLRAEAADRLAALVNAELANLYMPNARFAISITPREKLASHGADTIQFLLAPHSGAEFMELGRTASGGEMSRIMLAIEVSLASEADSAGHTFVFDEIDAGIGGKSALAVGKRLARLAEHSQVLCVTHLAQVAAYAHDQIVIAKGCDEGGASTTVRAVYGDEREIELARMLSGHSESHAARAHAAELLRSANTAL